ncbi:hypothetical protein Tcan_12603 [Toxocara canis]|uniref:Uncharacterized protein n=1 Tax=Toxocara canis TaxID=6265 RepID=A0A0B2V0P9_TOXCA|nr:hypothetical protein Tcan_12603 [Toxocara canis]
MASGRLSPFSAVVVALLVDSVVRVQSACLPPFRPMDIVSKCMLDKKLVPDKVFLKHMCPIFGGIAESHKCLTDAIELKRHKRKCGDGWAETYYHQVKYCVKAVKDLGQGDIKEVASKACQKASGSTVLQPWSKHINFFAFAQTGLDCNKADGDKYYIGVDYHHDTQKFTRVEVESTTDHFFMQGLMAALETNGFSATWDEGERLFVDKEGTECGSVVFSKCGQWKIVPSHEVNGVVCFKMAT